MKKICLAILIILTVPSFLRCENQLVFNIGDFKPRNIDSSGMADIVKFEVIVRNDSDEKIQFGASIEFYAPNGMERGRAVIGRTGFEPHTVQKLTAVMHNVFLKDIKVAKWNVSNLVVLKYFEKKDQLEKRGDNYIEKRIPLIFISKIDKSLRRDVSGRKEALKKGNQRK